MDLRQLLIEPEPERVPVRRPSHTLIAVAVAAIVTVAVVFCLAPRIVGSARLDGMSEMLLVRTAALAAAAGIGVLLLVVRVYLLHRDLTDARKKIAAQQSHLVQQQDRLLAQSSELEQTAVFQMEATNRFEQASRRFQELFEGLPVACFCYDAGGRIFEWNRACEALYGYAADQVLLRSIWDTVIPENARDQVASVVERVFQGESFQGLELEELLPDGRKRYILYNTFPLRGNDDAVVGAISANMDITQRKQAEETVHWQAYHDVLTHLPNRILFQDRLRQAMAAAERSSKCVAVLFFDLDHFKRINDTLGHAVGDLLLQQVASRLSQNLRAEDTVARMGGDEFTLLLPAIAGPAAAVNVAQKILRILADPFLLHSHELYVTTSIGVAIYPNDGRDAETLLKNADTALYAAKSQGRGTYQLFNEAMNATAFEHLILENSLRKALERSELTMHYQPQIHLKTGAIFGVEALLRWNHPDLGLVPPARFIPLAEETGLIRPLGAWALRESCGQAARWAAAGTPLRMSVNLSARQFRHYGLIDAVKDALRESGLDPHCLDLELTETALMENGEIAAETLRDLKKLGVHLSVDDFGTGYSSLSYLRRFPLDVVKVDQVFVREIAEDTQDQAVVRAVIDLAHALDMKVIAEGVETPSQRDLLMRLGCDAAQGYLFSMPVPAERLEAILPGSPTLLLPGGF